MAWQALELETPGRRQSGASATCILVMICPMSMTMINKLMRNGRGFRSRQVISRSNVVIVAFSAESCAVCSFLGSGVACWRDVAVSL